MSNTKFKHFPSERINIMYLYVSYNLHIIAIHKTIDEKRILSLLSFAKKLYNRYRFSIKVESIKI